MRNQSKNTYKRRLRAILFNFDQAIKRIDFKYHVEVEPQNSKITVSMRFTPVDPFVYIKEIPS